MLTSPSVPTHNGGLDNEEYDLIVREHDELGGKFSNNPNNPNSHSNNNKLCTCWREGSRYTVLALLGRGTFGQVFKCRDEVRGITVAVKVLKNKPAYFRQGLLEIGTLTAVNTNCDTDGSKHTLRLLDHFVQAGHLCIVNELLGKNLYEQIKSGSFRGVTIKLARSYLKQLLDALSAIAAERIIHCDLKPENVLLAQSATGSSAISLIDFGSACFAHSGPLYTYVQSRHYRAPEVILGLEHTCAIDMWSLGCIAAELVLGIPLFPGATEYNQLFKITSLLGMPPAEMIEKGTKGAHFYKPDPADPKRYMLRPGAEYERETGARAGRDRRYVPYSSLEEFCAKVPMKTGYSPQDTAHVTDQREIRRAYLSFLRGLLEIDPRKRWTPAQARMHPFLTEVPMEDFGPDGFVAEGKKKEEGIMAWPRELAPVVTVKETEEGARLKELSCVELYDYFVGKMKNDKQLIDINTGKAHTVLADPINPLFISCVCDDDNSDDDVHKMSDSPVLEKDSINGIINNINDANDNNNNNDNNNKEKIKNEDRNNHIQNNKEDIFIKLNASISDFYANNNTYDSNNANNITKTPEPEPTLNHKQSPPTLISSLSSSINHDNNNNNNNNITINNNSRQISPQMSPIQMAQPNSMKPQLVPSDANLKFQLSPQCRSIHIHQHMPHMASPPPPIHLHRGRAPDLSLGVSPGGFGGRQQQQQPPPGYLQLRKTTAAAAAAAAYGFCSGSGTRNKVVPQQVISVPISFSNTKNISVDMGQSWSSLNRHTAPKIDLFGSSPTITVATANPNLISLGTSFSNLNGCFHENARRHLMNGGSGGVGGGMVASSSGCCRNYENINITVTPPASSGSSKSLLIGSDDDDVDDLIIDDV